MIKMDDERQGWWDSRSYPHARIGGFGGRIAHAGHPVRFLVEEDHVRDFAELGALFADVFFDVEHRGRIVLDIVRLGEVKGVAPQAQ